MSKIAKGQTNLIKNNHILNQNSPIYGTKKFFITSFLTTKPTKIQVTIADIGISIFDVKKSRLSNKFLPKNVRYDENSA